MNFKIAQICQGKHGHSGQTSKVKCLEMTVASLVAEDEA